MQIKGERVREPVHLPSSTGTSLFIWPQYVPAGWINSGDLFPFSALFSLHFSFDVLRATGNPVNEKQVKTREPPCTVWRELAGGRGPTPETPQTRRVIVSSRVVFHLFYDCTKKQNDILSISLLHNRRESIVKDDHP